MSGMQVISPNEVESCALNAPLPWLRRVLFFALVMASTLAGSALMLDILRPNGLLPLEMALLCLFTISFAWIVYSFWSAALGFILNLMHLDPLTLRPLPVSPNEHDAFTPLPVRTAVVMPVYNEDPDRILAGFETNLRSLARTGQIAHFDFYLLSDSQDPDIIAAERKGWRALQKRLGQLGRYTFYRRRVRNEGRKVGNIYDFCQRWGNQYENMIVLDADSIMTGRCMLELAQAMFENPKLGLVQTVPLPIRQQTLFGRFLQFAGTLYSPMLAAGMACWQTDSANYWGHNAIIRIAPFMQHCTLPRLRHRRGPFSGDILSHDFVEAALLRRAGWQVVLRADIKGSYEELPCNVLDYAVRDRRWAQGNIQHLALLGATGFTFINRLHLFFGAVAYISSLIWMLMLVLSSVDAVQRALSSNQFFSQQYQLFPDWQISKSDQIISLFVLTAALLFLPKVMGLLIGLTRNSDEYGGRLKLFTSAILEAVFAVLIAPLMMMFHSYFVLAILLGTKVNWNAQPREGRTLSWQETLRKTGPLSVLALVWGSVTYVYSPLFFWWLSPVLAGLVLSAPLVRFSSAVQPSRWLNRVGLLAIPAEIRPKPEFQFLSWRLGKPEPVSVARTRSALAIA
ncbi:MAG: glucans biosynthesis glucosyltransferase MdoH [Pseudomonadales bacterium]|nr:glucans biosynthesis glucosyltransferase MdoH [Pseudomonadales bacterium]HAG96478.1 glucans biosynthesis glucosyltransferase MdoH [Gammaproteobacteria bacterium]HAU16584.1 glucans biosynthesis glucosyltransferase MdoH [Gammaproteobacteria bacterium]HBO92118.1 glucans biosynthesis glucosyltransferase MdoH [Gammaproteobacteria bacterium]HCB39463.1 glucans biosynthesis glucosyltransferase MdoH [Gammaproteobacteria bacterium]